MLKVSKSLLTTAGLAALGVAAFFVAGVNQTEAAVGGPVCNVPSDYATIQAAVDDTGCNVVKVAPGTYSENVVVSRSVNIKGARAGQDVSSRTVGGPNESVVSGPASSATFTINAADVKLNGFSVTNPDHGLGIVVKTAGNNAVIQNNFVSEVGSATFTSNAVGIYLELGPDGVKVLGNSISNVQSKPSAQGMLVGDSTSNDPSLDTVIRGNVISGITSTNPSGGYGIQVNNGAKSTATGYAVVKITKNKISDLSGKWVHAIGLEGPTPNVVVRFNELSGLNASTADKIGVYFEDNIFFFTGTVNRNNLDVGSDAFGVAVNPGLVAAYPTLEANATCNWWGAKDGPGVVATGSGSMVGPGADYEPWLKSDNLDGKCGQMDKDHDDHFEHHGHFDKHKHKSFWNRIFFWRH